MPTDPDFAKFIERRPYGLVIEHVRHRWVGSTMERLFGDRVIRTVCGKRFVAGGKPRDWEHHEPETSRCSVCAANGAHNVSAESQ